MLLILDLILIILRLSDEDWSQQSIENLQVKF